MSIPNTLTFIRIVFIPCFIIGFYMQVSWNNWIVAVIFAMAGFTDWLDGYMARKLNQTTPFGAFLDPVADKLMVACALIMLINWHPNMAYTMATLIIVGRELVVTALREWMASQGKSDTVAVSFVGKLKTVAQMVAIETFLINGQSNGQSNGFLFYLGYGFIFAAALLTIWSMVLYLKSSWPALSSAMRLAKKTPLTSKGREIE